MASSGAAPVNFPSPSPPPPPPPPGPLPGSSDSFGSSEDENHGFPAIQGVLPPCEESRPAVRQVRRLLHKSIRVGIEDGRVFVGTFHCLDKQGNLILYDTVELRYETLTHHVGKETFSDGVRDVNCETESRVRDEMRNEGQALADESSGKGYVGGSARTGLDAGESERVFGEEEDPSCRQSQQGEEQSRVCLGEGEKCSKDSRIDGGKRASSVSAGAFEEIGGLNESCIEGEFCIEGRSKGEEGQKGANELIEEKDTKASKDGRGRDGSGMPGSREKEGQAGSSGEGVGQAKVLTHQRPLGIVLIPGKYRTSCEVECNEEERLSLRGLNLGS
eukprot:TRINITY_DN901_c4_g1_i1.p1 TRINITY_DN901_c4_g1~~TRINITY_DN901_c4_g1_i1.p1  ORF type:complete len:332 (-),score=66.92 TRINITY_DN901_c4_g1_i1:121-1116(-)